MKVLFLPKYNTDGASSRYRTYQYLPMWKESGLNFSVVSFYFTGYVKNLYGKKWINLIFYPLCILRRVVVVFLFSFRYDLLVIEKEAIPYFPPFLEKFLSIFNKAFILDYDDAIYYNYIKSSNRFVQKLFSKKIPSIMSWASGIVVGSPELALFAEQFNHNVVEIPTSLDLDKYNRVYLVSEGKPFIIGWIGSISTSRYVDTIMGALMRFIEKYENVEIRLVGYSGNISRENKHIKVVKWSARTEVDELNNFDVGIMPLIDTPFEHGKCGFKLIQYMACGKPTISTPFLANLKIDGGIGNLFAETDNEWYDCFSTVYNNQSEFEQIGKENKERVVHTYSIQANANKYINFYKSIKRLK